MEPRITIITLGVRDMPTAIRFYRDGLGWPTEAGDDAGWALFATVGTRLSLFPYEALAADVSPDLSTERPAFAGITLAHNVRTREEVDEVLREAVAAGGTLVKEAQEADWGGYSGYFADPDGYLWEVAYGPNTEFEEDGTMKV